MANILITGIAGYIGSRLAEALVEQGHRVTGIDKMLFGDKGIEKIKDKIHLEVMDIRDLSQEQDYLFEGQDWVIHLAAIANDPIGDINRNSTFSINSSGTKKVAEMSKYNFVKNFIYASSASVYGFNPDLVDESSELNPQTAYAESKIISETELNKLVDADFNVWILRQGTVSGVSNRMRYDLIINSMVKSVKEDKRVVIYGDENTERPLLAIGDLIDGYIDIINGKIPSGLYNFASGNHKVKDVASAIATRFDVPVFYGYVCHDNRSYRMNTNLMDAFRTQPIKRTTPIEIAEEVYYNFPKPDATTQSLSWIRHLMNIHPYIKKWENVI